MKINRNEAAARLFHLASIFCKPLHEIADALPPSTRPEVRERVRKDMTAIIKRRSEDASSNDFQS